MHLLTRFNPGRSLTELVGTSWVPVTAELRTIFLRVGLVTSGIAWCLECRVLNFQRAVAVGELD